MTETGMLLGNPYRYAFALCGVSSFQERAKKACNPNNRTAAATLHAWRPTLTLAALLPGCCRRGERRPGTVGQPFPGVEVRITNAGGSDAGAGELVRMKPSLKACVKCSGGCTGASTGGRQLLHSRIATQASSNTISLSHSCIAGPGELRVRGPQLFKEYWRRPAPTAEAFDNQGFFLTGWLPARPASGSGGGLGGQQAGGHRPRGSGPFPHPHPHHRIAALCQLSGCLVCTSSCSAGDTSVLEQGPRNAASGAHGCCSWCFTCRRHGCAGGRGLLPAAGAHLSGRDQAGRVQGKPYFPSGKLLFSFWL